MTLEQVFTYIVNGGAVGVLALWVWLERDERISIAREWKESREKSEQRLSEALKLANLAIRRLNGKSQ
jgi:hypothetical protein